jgi:HlyD family secretion protein
MNKTVEFPIAESIPETQAAFPAPIDVAEFSGPPWWRRPLPWILLTLVVASAAGAWYWQKRAPATNVPAFVTALVTKGNLRVSVTANGTLQPTRTVSIGSELSGTVSRVLVEVNDRVKKGQVLVELDTSKFGDLVTRAKATLASATAKVAQADATVKEAEGNLARLKEVQRLSGGKVPSSAELDTAQATLDRARADASSARASVTDAQAALQSEVTNLGKASIKSPIDGVVLTRAVDPGNAVAASLQAVTLFTIAEDLAHMKLQVNVDEADVGMVNVGQNATFTVAAYPSRRFPAKITRVAYGSTTTDNVVTYITYLEVDNPDLALRPGMTATATINATERNDVLLVPNTALRFTPATTRSPGGDAKDGSGPPKSGGGGIVGSLVPRPPEAGAQRPATTANRAVGGARQVWVAKNGQAVPVPVTVGISDGRLTEVSSPDLAPGTPVIVDQRAAAQ